MSLDCASNSRTAVALFASRAQLGGRRSDKIGQPPDDAGGGRQHAVSPIVLGLREEQSGRPKDEQPRLAGPRRRERREGRQPGPVRGSHGVMQWCCMLTVGGRASRLRLSMLMWERGPRGLRAAGRGGVGRMGRQVTWFGPVRELAGWLPATLHHRAFPLKWLRSDFPAPPRIAHAHAAAAVPIRLRGHTGKIFCQILNTPITHAQNEFFTRKIKKWTP